MGYGRTRLTAILLIASLSLAAGDQPVKVAPGDKCPVCGMFVAKYPDFVAQVIFKDGSYAVFDGVKDMMKYYFNFPKYNPAKTASDISRIWVTDYYALELIDGVEAFYVIGSNVYGPMGHELIPFKDEAGAQEFLKDHQGKSQVRFNRITPEIVAGLD
ncbi:MAG: nitrous oxide reductase accessory protein NosL [Deltaproteobacteria bacterium]|nr:nitrous oxide reductase accessory protein NosL [Deltaproteobacteria bacterium]